MADIPGRWWRDWLFKKPVTVSEIHAAKESKDLSTILRGLTLANPDVNRAAADCLETVYNDLDVPHLSVLRKVLARAQRLSDAGDGFDPAPAASDPMSGRLAEAIDHVRAKGWASISKGIRTRDVLRRMGRPDFAGTGREFVDTFRVGIIFDRGDVEFPSLPHWVWRNASNPESYRLIVFRNDEVIHIQSQDNPFR